MASSHPPDDVAARQQLVTLNASLENAEEQLKAQGDALLQRSKLKTTLGDHAGALDDAKRALALFPAHPQYLICTASACLRNGRSDKAVELVLRAHAAFDAQGCDEDVKATLSALDRRLRPLHYLPDEVLAIVFEHVYADWARLPSPHQLLHVCERWRKLALATPSLWGDMRILRVVDKLEVKGDRDCRKVRKAFCFNDTTPYLERLFDRKGGNQWKLMRMTCELSRKKLTHLEFELDHRHASDELVERLFMVMGEHSRETLQSISIVDKNTYARAFYMAGEREEQEGSLLAAMAVDFVLRCPRLHTVDLSVGELLFTPRRNPDYDSADDEGEDEEFLDSEYDFQSLWTPETPATPFADVKIDTFDGFNMFGGQLVRDRFLQRCSQIRSLTIANVPKFDVSEFLPSQPAFAHEVLATCADTLVQLEVGGQANVLKGASRAGITSFPKLRQFRHAASEKSQDYAEDDMQGLTMDNLRHVEAPIGIVRGLPRLPNRVTIRFDQDDSYDQDCRKTADWLLSLGAAEGPRTLIFLMTFERPARDLFDAVIAALTPSNANKVACGNLQELAVLCKAAFHRDPADHCFSFDPVPRLKPLVRDQWERLPIDATKLANMEEERRRLSQGIQPASTKAQRKSPRNRGTSRKGSSKKAALAADDGKVWPRCEALTSIEIEGCFVQPEAWHVMEKSECSFSVVPDPDEMAQLPTEEEYNEKLELGQPQVYAM